MSNLTAKLSTYLHNIYFTQAHLNMFLKQTDIIIAQTSVSYDVFVCLSESIYNG